MEFTLAIAAAAALIALIILIWWVRTSNGFKRRQIKIKEALSGIEVALTKRWDMLTKLLDVAKGFSGHERELFAEVVSLRRGMSVGELSGAAGQMDAVASRLNVVAEAYPQLRSSEVFVQLQAGIRDAEEHLQAARRLYNSNVTGFNTALQVFPSGIVGKAMKLEDQAFFEAEAAKRADVPMRF
ncbi:MAG: LemA family protein [Firmicutes bacterium]|nr:LemA family protein [Bacillota bacterium]